MSVELTKADSGLDSFLLTFRGATAAERSDPVTKNADGLKDITPTDINFIPTKVEILALKSNGYTVSGVWTETQDITEVEGNQAGEIWRKLISSAKMLA